MGHKGINILFHARIKVLNEKNLLTFIKLIFHFYTQYQWLYNDDWIYLEY